MTDQAEAPAMFQGSLYFGGQPSVPQSTSSWGALGQTVPSQAAQPNHQSHDFFQNTQTWNGFQSSYHDSGVQQQTAAAYQGSFMEEYSPKASELEWFQMGTQEQPQFMTNSEEPSVKNDSGNLYDQENAVDGSLDGESDLESRSATTSGSTSPEDSHVEPGGAWLEEEIDDSELDAVQEKTSATQAFIKSPCSYQKTAFQTAQVPLSGPCAVWKAAFCVPLPPPRHFQFSTLGPFPDTVQPQMLPPRFDQRIEDVVRSVVPPVQEPEPPALASCDVAKNLNTVPLPDTVRSQTLPPRFDQRIEDVARSVVPPIQEPEPPAIASCDVAQNLNTVPFPDTVQPQMLPPRFDQRIEDVGRSVVPPIQEPEPLTIASCGGAKNLNTVSFPDTLQPQMLPPRFDQRIEDVVRPVAPPIQEPEPPAIASCDGAKNLNTVPFPDTVQPQRLPPRFDQRIEDVGRSVAPPIQEPEPPAIASCDVAKNLNTVPFPDTVQPQTLPPRFDQRIEDVGRSVAPPIQEPQPPTIASCDVAKNLNTVPFPDTVQPQMLPPRFDQRIEDVVRSVAPPIQEPEPPAIASCDGAKNLNTVPFPDAVQPQMLPPRFDQRIEDVVRPVAPPIQEPEPPTIASCGGAKNLNTVSFPDTLQPQMLPPRFDQRIEDVGRSVAPPIQEPEPPTIASFDVAKNLNTVPFPDAVQPQMLPPRFDQRIEDVVRPVVPPIQEPEPPAIASCDGAKNLNTVPFPDTVQPQMLPPRFDQRIEDVGRSVAPPIQEPEPPTIASFDVAKNLNTVPFPDTVQPQMLPPRFDQRIEDATRSVTPPVQEPEPPAIASCDVAKNLNTVPFPDTVQPQMLPPRFDQRIEDVARSVAPPVREPEPPTIASCDGAKNLNTVPFPDTVQPQMLPPRFDQRIEDVARSVALPVREPEPPTIASCDGAKNLNTVPFPDTVQPQMLPPRFDQRIEDVARSVALPVREPEPPAIASCDVTKNLITNQSKAASEKAILAGPAINVGNQVTTTLPSSLASQAPFVQDPKGDNILIVQKPEQLQTVSASSKESNSSNQSQSAPPTIPVRVQSAERIPSAKQLAQTHEEVSPSREGPSMMQHRALRATQKEHAQSSPCTSLWTSVPKTVPTMMLVAPVPSSQKNEELNVSGTSVNQDISRDGVQETACDTMAIYHQDSKKQNEQLMPETVTKGYPEGASEAIFFNRDKETGMKDLERKENQSSSERIDRGVPLSSKTKEFRDDLRSSRNYKNPGNPGDRGTYETGYSGDYSDTRRESHDYLPSKDDIDLRNEYRKSISSRDHERPDNCYTEEHKDFRRESRDSPLKNVYHVDDRRNSKSLKDNERQGARYNNPYEDERQSQDFPERHDRDLRQSRESRERGYNRHHNDYDLGKYQDYRERRHNRYGDDYRDSRHLQGHSERHDDRPVYERRESRDYYDRQTDPGGFGDDREFRDRRERSGMDYGGEYRDNMDRQDHYERHFDRYGEDYRTSGRKSRERYDDYSKDSDRYYDSKRNQDYSSRWEDHRGTWDHEDERYRRSSQYSPGYSDRHTPVHSGRSTPTSYYDYAGHYGNTYGYNYQWDNYWGQYQQYPHYYPGYPGYGYYYPDYTDYAGYASGQDQSYVNNQEQHPGTDSLHGEWPEQQEAEPQPAPEPARLTPVPFPRPHVALKFGPGGLLVTVHANHPQDGQKASLDISHVKAMFNEQEQRLMNNFPGPLSRHETVRKDVIRYTSEMADSVVADQALPTDQKQAISMMWKFLGLLCKQNGMFSMADIAELLVMQHREFKREAAGIITSESEHRNAEMSDVTSNEEDHVTQRSVGDSEGDLPLTGREIDPLSAEAKLLMYREMLITGSRKEALEFAMKKEMWGHALTLASKMDSRTFGNIVARFQSSFSATDPLQTVYLHLGGRQPVAVTGSDEWMLHLAAMISNASQFPDSDRRNITTLGDSLANRGLLYAAHLCYLLAGWPIGNTADSETKVALIGADHKSCRDPSKLFRFANFQMTEVFEYALSLKSEEFSMPAFQLYKFLYATKLSEAGLYGKAMHYLETIAARILLHPAQQNTVLVRQVYEMADRLQGFDEIARQSGDEGVNFEWIEMLNKHLQAKDSAMVLSQGSLEESATTEGEIDPLAQSSTSFFSGYDPASVASVPEPPLTAPVETSPLEPTADAPGSGGSSFQQQPLWSLDHQASYSSIGAASMEPAVNETGELPQQPGTPPQDDFDSFHRHANPGLFKGLAVDEGPRFSQQATPLFPPRPEFNEPPKVPQPEPPVETRKEEPVKNETKSAKNEKAANGNQKGWFSGLFSKIIPKSSNEMKLPDDNKKTIYYDKDKGCWVNTEEDEADKTPLAPPPTDLQLMGGAPPPPPPPMPVPVQGPPGPFTGGVSQPMAVPSHPAPAPAPAIQPGGSNPVSTTHGPSGGAPQLPVNQVQTGSTTRGSFPGEEVAENEGPPPPPSKFSRKAHGLGRAGARSKYVDVLNPGASKKSVEPPPSLLPIFPTATTTLPGNFFVPQPVPVDDADGVSSPQIGNPSSRPASVGSEEGIVENVVKQRSRSSSQSSGSLSQTSAEVRSYFNHTQDQGQSPYQPQLQYDQQYTQQQRQQTHLQQQQNRQQQQQSQQPGQPQFANQHNPFYSQPPQSTTVTQQRQPTQQKQPIQNQGQHYNSQNTEQDAQTAPPMTAPLLFNPASFQTQPMSPSTTRRGRYGRPR